MQQGEIVLVRLDPAKGAELGKLRPAIILTAQQILAQDQALLFVCPLTTKVDPRYEALLVPIPARDNLLKNSYAAIPQCRSISQRHVVNKTLARCTRKELGAILDHLLLLTDAETLLAETRCSSF